jgi:hypothetical protein
MSNIDQIIKNSAKKAKPRKLYDFEIERVYGKEPSWDGVENTQDNFKSLVGAAVNWVNASYEHADYKEEVIKYATLKGMPVGKLETIADWKFVNAGKAAWLVNNGCPLTEDWLTRFKLNIDKLLKETDEMDNIEIAEDGTVVVLEAKPKLFEKRNRTQAKKVTEQVMYIEELIDNAIMADEQVNESIVYKEFVEKKIDEKTAKQVFDKLNERSKVFLNEIDALENYGDDSKIVMFDDEETFTNYLENIRENANQYIEVANQIGAYLGNKRAIKKSERKHGSKFKAKRIEAQVSNVNFKLQDSEYKVASITPASVIGSQTLLAFNTKSRKMAVYIAANEEGLSIKGTTIQNFDEVKSFQKIIKKPDMVKKLQEGNIKRVENLLNDVRAKVALVNGRLNEHTVLLKTYKETYGK